MATKKLQILDSLNKNAVLYTPQKLTEEEKAQVRDNLSVPSLDENGKIPTSQLPDDIGGGVTSWNDLEDKPFYDTRVRSYYSQAENPNPPQIDNAMMNISCYKVSDLVPTRTEIFSSTKLIVNEQEYILDESGIQLETDDFVFVGTSGGFGFIFVNKSGTLNFDYIVGGSVYPMSIEVPENGEGIYYQRGYNAGVPEGRTIEFRLGGELKTLDPKYLPQGGVGYESKPFEDIVWDGNTDGLTPVTFNMEADGETFTYTFYKISDNVLIKEDYIGATVVMSYSDGSTGEGNVSGSDDIVDIGSNGSFALGDFMVANIVQDNDGIDLTDLIGIETTLIFPEAGIWFLCGMQNGETIVKITELLAPSNITQIDSKYLPIGIANGVASLDYAGFVPLNQIRTSTMPYSGDNNLITSGAVYEALGSRSSLTIDDTVSQYSFNPVSSQAVYTAIENKKINVDSSVQSGSNNAISGGAVYNALGNRNSLSFDLSPINGSNNPITSGAVYTANNTINNTINNTFNTLNNSKMNVVSVTTNDNGKFMRVINGKWAAVTVPNVEEGEF